MLGEMSNCMGKEIESVVVRNAEPDVRVGCPSPSQSLSLRDLGCGSTGALPRDL